MKAKTNDDRTFLSDLESANMCRAIAIGAIHQSAVGSKAKLRNTPARADRQIFTNPMH